MIAPTSLCGSSWSAKTSWRLAEPIGSSNRLPIIIKLNHKICYNKPVIPRSARWCWNGVDWSSQKCAISLMNLTYLFQSLTSVTSWSLQQQLTLENLNPARNLNLGWPHTCKPKSAHEIASVKQFITFARSGLMLVMELLRLSMRPGQKHLLQNEMTNSDGPNIWEVIQGLNSTPDANPKLTSS